MILRPSKRPQSLLRTFVRLNNTSRFQQRRCEHTVPQLGNNNSKGTFFESNGVPGFLTPTTYKQTWKAYQQHLCDEVNQTTEGLVKYANQPPLDLHQTFAHTPEYASLYNSAAMLHFNHFWWESLATEKKPIPSPLAKQIEDNFSSVEELRVEMLQHADAMFGNGFVWLVKEGANSVPYGTSAKTTPLRVICTYNAGSPYPGAHQRRQTQDMATADTSAMAARLSGRGSQLTEVQNSVGAFGQYSDSKTQPWPNALLSQPILCVNVWQHMYMLDYGLLGKQTYLAAWWERIDWDVVYQRYNMDVGYGRTSPLQQYRS